MADARADTIDKVNRIKQKLVKYSEKKLNTEKVAEYIGALQTLPVNAEIAKATDICQLLKVLKKKDNPEFSRKAAELIKQLTKDDNSNCKYEPTPINNNASKSKSSISEKPYNPSKKSTSHHKTEKSSSSSHKLKSSESSKRLSDLNSEQLRRGEKQPKLSLSDYKKNHIVEDFDIFDTIPIEENGNENFLETSKTEPSVKYEEESNENEYLPQLSSVKAEYKPQYNPSELNEQRSTKNKLPVQERPKNKLPTQSKSTSQNNYKEEPYEPESVPQKKQPKDLVNPPAPSMSLEDLFSSGPSSKQEEPYEPKPVSMNGRARGSGYTPAVKNEKAEETKTAAEIDEALSRIMRMKQSKRMIYTGKKNNCTEQAAVPSLYKLCSKTLVDNLDSLPSKISTYNMTHDFAIAFDLLKPVLERANAKQLENVENYSPHLLSDTDYIWKKISEQEFKKMEEPDDDESWRELYFKMLDDREKKFERARSLVSKMQKSKPVERVTQIATLKYNTKTNVYLGPKTYNGMRSGQSAASSNSSKAPSSGYSKSAPKVVHHAAHKPSVTNRVPPVMSQGMRAMQRMMKVRKK